MSTPANAGHGGGGPVEWLEAGVLMTATLIPSLRSIRTWAAVFLVVAVVAGCQSAATGAPTSTVSSASPTSAIVVPPPITGPTAPPSGSPSASSSPSGSPSVAGAPDPCALFTVDEASTLLGVTLTKTGGGDVGKGGRNCVYSSGPATHVTVFDRTEASADAIDSVFDAIEQQTLAEAGAVGGKITDLGDAAFESRVPGAGGKSIAVIAFVAGPTYVSLTTYPGPSDSSLHDAATVALGRL